MPKVPEIHHKPLNVIHRVNDPKAYASDRQKAFLKLLHERHGLPVPYMQHLKKGEAAILISQLVNKPVDKHLIS